MTTLDRLFVKLNQQYFDGRLPAHKVRRRALGIGHYGQADHRRRLIFVARGREGEDLRRTLVHEMCHVAVGGDPEHGERFQEELKRIGKQFVETWALDEAEIYANQVSPRAEIESVIEGIVTDLPTLPWKDVRKLLSANLNPSGIELPRWARTYWKSYRRRVGVKESGPAH